MQLKDGEESEVNGVTFTFTVELNVRSCVLMVQNVRRGCPAYSVSVAGGALLRWSVCEE